MTLVLCVLCCFGMLNGTRHYAWQMGRPLFKALGCYTKLVEYVIQYIMYASPAFPVQL